MIALTKINGEIIVINSKQIEHIDVIPESKITMMNGKYYIVARKCRRDHRQRDPVQQENCGSN